MYEAERERAILRVVAEQDFVSVQDLTQRLDISEATIRRDLKRLSEGGRIRRVRGGAQSIERPVLTGQPQFGTDQGRNAAAKRAIAERAAGLCEPGDSIVLDGGTTVFAMTEFLGSMGLRVLTNSFPVAHALSTSTTNRVSVLGGEIYREQQVIASPYPQPMVAGFSARRLFLSAQAVGLHGLMQTDPLLIHGSLALLERAEEVVALVDSSKFERRGVHVSCPLQKVDVLITDAGISAGARRMVTEAGVSLVIAEVR